MGPATAPRGAIGRSPASVCLAAVLLLTGFPLSSAAAAPAAPSPVTRDDPSAPPDFRTNSVPVQIDSDDPGLRMRDGATLAQSRVLDIVSIVETEGGEERREETTTSLKFALQAEVLFGKDSAALSTQSNSRIAAIVAEIEKNRPRKIRVFGFTDNLGTYEHGRALSRKRADAVHGVISGRLNDGGVSYEVRGYSEDYPIADNATEEGRRKNRRVEVSFPTGRAG